MPRDPQGDEQLAVLWATFGRNIPFQPDGTATVAATSILIDDLKTEFQNPPSRNINFTAKDIDPGDIKTVDNLVQAVSESS